MTKNSLPQHVALIPDGNRRWAKKRGLPNWKGHLEGAKRVEEIVQSAIDLNIKYFTLWGGSYHNLTKRSKSELIVLNRIHKDLARKLIKSKVIHEKQVRIRFIGEWPKLLEKGVVKLMREAEEKTATYTAYNHSYLVGYSGDREMLDGINRLIGSGHHRITDNLLKSYLWTADLPPVDLVIRTGGEPHLSTGFMMWHTRYAQLYFTDTFWPDFKKTSFEEALREYGQRERRFGK